MLANHINGKCQMNGFYLSVNKNSNNNVELFSSPYELLQGSDTKWQLGLRIFEDERSQIARSNGYTAFNIGTLVYRDQWQNKALELLISDLSSGRSMRDVMSDTRGQFCLVVHTDKNVFVITDKLGSFPVYIFEDSDTIQISNILLLLARNNSVSVDHQAIGEYLSFDSCLGTTFFNEIKPLKMSSVYEFPGNSNTQVYTDTFSDIHFNKYTDINKAANVAKEMLVHNLSFLDSDDRIFVDVTGGFDTRTVSTILGSMKVDFEAGICGEQILNEIELAERVAQNLGVKFHSDIKIKDRHLFRQILEYHFAIGTGVPILYQASELINYYENIRREYDIHLTGIGGTELTTQNLPRLNLLSSRINKKTLVQKSFRYNDVFLSSFLTKTRYYNNLAEKIDSLLTQIGSDLHAEVATFLRFSSVSRYYHGCLVGTHNVILPFYSPFLESNYVRLMMETSYNLKDRHAIQRAILTELNPTVSSIMTTHGYSANIDSEKINSAFEKSKKCVKNLARQIVYQFGLSGIVRSLRNITRKNQTMEKDMAELHRCFWVDEVNELWSNDMEIFDIIDRDKLSRYLANKTDVAYMKAKILYLNRILNECKPKL